MALLTAPPERAVMLVVLVVATGATGCQFQFAERWSLVAVPAFEVLVLALQLESGLVVVEIPVLPVASVVAFLTSRPQRALVSVFLFVAGPAIRLGIFEFRRQMTFLAFRYLMLTCQRIT